MFKKFCKYLVVLKFNSLQEFQRLFDFLPKQGSKAVCCEAINVGKIAFNLFEIALDNTFVSTFNKEIGLQLLMYCLSRSFFSMSLIKACLYEILKVLL